MSESFMHVNSLNELTQKQPTFLAIGSFDGVHCGHQAMLRQMVAAARAAGARTAVLTFFPHPKRVIQNLSEPYYLCTLPQRVALLADLGIDLIITHSFDEDVRHTSAADFMAKLRQALDLRQLWGGNFALGHNREGDIPTLRALGAQMGYTVQAVDTMTTWADETVSSSRIRASLAAGDIEDVNSCLQRPYRVCGGVMPGDQRGRTIGFPTANLDVWAEQLLPAHGVYATWAEVNGRRYPAATNIGVRPTVDGSSLRVEAHLLDFSGDLYGETICLDFVARIRPEMRFAGLEALQAQIQQDVQQVRTILTP